MRKALAVARKELRQIVRDRRTLLVILVVPIFFLWLYGYALNFDIRRVPLAVADRDASPQSREVVSAFLDSRYFELVAVVRDDGEIGRLLDSGRARAVLVLPAQLGARLEQGFPQPVQVLIDGSNANTAATIVGYADAIVRGVSSRLRAGTAQAPVAGPSVSIEPRVWFNPALESTIFLVPGLVAYIAMITAVVSTALSIVREKERGTMEQIRMAPLGTLSFVVGKSVPYFALSFVSSMAILLVAMALFDVPMRGSWLLLVLSTGLFLVGALGMGLFVSTVAESQQVAFQIALIASFLPTFVLSGFIFPIASMPVAVQLVTYLVPARYYLVALREVVLKGAGLEPIAPQLVALALFGAGVIALSAIRLARQEG